MTRPGFTLGIALVVLLCALACGAGAMADTGDTGLEDTGDTEVISYRGAGCIESSDCNTGGAPASMALLFVTLAFRRR